MVCGIISADPGGSVSNRHHNIDSPIFDANMTWNLLIKSVWAIYFSTKVNESKNLLISQHIFDIVPFSLTEWLTVSPLPFSWTEYSPKL